MTEETGSSKPLRRRGFIAGALGALGATLFARTDRAAAQGEFPPEEEIVLQRTLRFRQANEGVSAISVNRGNDVAILDATAAESGRMPLQIDAALLGQSHNNAGVLANSPNLPVVGVHPDFDPSTATVTATAVLGLAGAQTGVWGASKSGIGVWGTSDWVGMQGWSPWGIGVLGATAMEDWDVGQEWPPAGVFAVSRDEVGMWAISGKNIASWGASDEFIGVQGIGGHIGAWFIRGRAEQIGENPGGLDARDLEPAALHTTALGDDVSACFRAEHGVAAMAEAMHHDGVALKTMGRIQSDLVGKGVVQEGSDQGIVPCGHVTPDSHVQITFGGDPGGTHWVRLDPGKGFVLNLSKKADKGGLPFTFSVVESATEHEG